MSALAALMIAPMSCSDVRFTWAPGGWPDGAVPAAIQDRSYRTRPLRSGASVRAQTEGQALFSAERSLSSISHAWSSVWKAECRMRNGSVHDRMRFATSPAL